MIVGMLAFWEPNAELIGSLSSGLAAFAGATFGIIGIWLALLNPLRVFDAREKRDEDKQLLVDKLRPFFKLSIAAFAASVGLRLIISVVPPAVETLSRWLVDFVKLVADVSIALPKPATEWIELVARISVGSLLILLYMAQVVVILANLLPLFDSEKKSRESAWQQAKNTKKHQRTER